MLVKLDARFDSSTTAIRIGTMCDLVSTKDNNIHDGLGAYIDRMRSMMSKLEATNMSLSEQLQIGLLVASIEAPELSAVCAAIKTLCDDQTTWETITTRLLDENRTLRLRHPQRANPAHSSEVQCASCHRSGHETRTCLLDPTNPDSRLGIKVNGKTRKKKNKGGKDVENKENKDKQNNDKNVNEMRAAVARAIVVRTPKLEEFILDSGTTIHMTPHLDSLEQTRTCNVNIALGDDSIVKAGVEGTLTVKWNHCEQNTTVKLTRTLGLESLSMNLLSIPALTSDDLDVLFMPDHAYIIDLRDKFQIIGTAPK
eukprot:gb/GEZJ01001039.1/.p1 GENE.gb/GEZJ01001039.1/~~gb/GEZJ01001039.1/.p1  ORF type:complete len:312 (-),score=43.94 gb/GEZJ01001039.1/:3064-3999(-)